jgi:hypothetical protein
MTIEHEPIIDRDVAVGGGKAECEQGIAGWGTDFNQVTELVSISTPHW